MSHRMEAYLKSYLDLDSLKPKQIEHPVPVMSGVH